MPLEKSTSDEARSRNIAEEIRQGKPKDQAVAIGYSIQREAGKKDEDEEEAAVDLTVPFAYKPGTTPTTLKSMGNTTKEIRSVGQVIVRQRGLHDRHNNMVKGFVLSENNGRCRVLLEGSKHPIEVNAEDVVRATQAFGEGRSDGRLIQKCPSPASYSLSRDSQLGDI